MQTRNGFVLKWQDYAALIVAVLGVVGLFVYSSTQKALDPVETFKEMVGYQPNAPVVGSARPGTLDDVSVYHLGIANFFFIDGSDEAILALYARNATGHDLNALVLPVLPGTEKAQTYAGGDETKIRPWRSRMGR
ncbi:MAG: hypothetical protein IRY83_17060 [Chloroflexi bacterium]|nr:hypothetical protein [Chloroflexota bacterium]